MYGVVWLRESISPSPQLPDQLGDGESLCEKIASFFTDKIDRIRAAVDSVPVTNFDLNHDTDLEQFTTTTLVDNMLFGPPTN